MIKSILFWCFAFDSTSVNGVVGSQSFSAILKVTSPVKLPCDAEHKMNGPTAPPHPPPREKRYSLIEAI